MALNALDKASSFDFDVSADLIFGLPLQTLRTWHDSLRRVLASGVGHVSVYQLTLEPNTPLGRENPSLPEGYPFYRFAQWYLPRKGLVQYEIASFARSGTAQCRHNLAYWRQENVLALGPAAWGYLAGDGFRYHNAQTLEDYIALTATQLPLVEAERLEGRHRGIEAAILALRTCQGINLSAFGARFGRELAEEVLAVLKRMPQHLVRYEDLLPPGPSWGNVSLTPHGMRVANAIWVELLELGD
jgi:oxygen-independent coproporphyrinogen-3 oxidase